MAIHNEVEFESHICDHLASHGWLYSADDTEYDADRALVPCDLMAWLHDTQANQMQRLLDALGTEQAVKSAVLDRVVDRLAHPTQPNGGTLGVLRKEIQVPAGRTSVSLRLCQFEPASTVNRALSERASRVRLRVMRQVHYSKRNRKSIDLVLFVNGLPVATVELKSDYTQAVDNAMRQYRQDRPVGEGRTAEPLLQAGVRALVHFAVSNTEVYYTTRLDGENTVFLPFNQGGPDGGAGNPVTDGIATSYLWERVWEPTAWLRLLGRFVHTQPLPKTLNMHDGARNRSRGRDRGQVQVLFPRFHQWDVVTKIIDAIKRDGVQQRFLIQHSAGSGKTNEISWTAHQLARLHDGTEKVYSSVIVVTDRLVLDRQLQRAIQQIDESGIMVTPVNAQEASRRGYRSKSELLAAAISNRDPIIVTTIQTFKYALERMDQQPGSRFAVIIDEAHQSQDGETGRHLDAALTAPVGSDFDEDTEVEEAMRNRAFPAHLTFVAFTATPKPSTLTLFGQPTSDGQGREPFHVYSMKQAIEEGFILDVLRAYRAIEIPVRFTTAPATATSTGVGEQLVDTQRARAALAARAYEDPQVIAVKAKEIVDHYQRNVHPLLDGRAKGMVIAASRRAAVRFHAALQREARTRGIDLGILVAFSGSVTDHGPHTETSLNLPDTSGSPDQDPPSARVQRRRSQSTSEPSDLFTRDDERLIVVANKYQTGFDQPLLCALYLDKPLRGINAVQTLSRLNRTFPALGKNLVYVVDFNHRVPGTPSSAEHILSAFRRYYTEARLPEDVQPWQIHDLRHALDAPGFYTDADITTAATAALRGDLNALDAVIHKIATDWHTRYADAEQHDDEQSYTEATTFKVNLARFIDGYAFLSQVHDFNDADMERRFIVLRLLQKRLTGEVTQRVDLSGVNVHVLAPQRGEERSLNLSGEADPLRSDAYEVAEQTPEVRLERTLREVIEEFNAYIDDLGIDPSVAGAWFTGVNDTLLHDERLVALARDNNAEDLAVTGALKRALGTQVDAADTDFTKLRSAFDDDPDLRQVMAGLAARLIHAFANDEDAHAAGGRHRAVPTGHDGGPHPAQQPSPYYSGIPILTSPDAVAGHRYTGGVQR